MKLRFGIVFFTFLILGQGKKSDIPNHMFIREIQPNHREILTEHNEIRRKIGGWNLRQMQWSTRLAQTAQEHSDRCYYRGSTAQENGGAGENLLITNTLNYSSVVKRWNSAGKCSNMVDRTCSYYGQLVWPKTYMVGCGVTECRVMAHGDSYISYKYMVVCHYWPRALVPTRTNDKVKAYNPASPGKSSCSTCQAEGQQFFQCLSGLCVLYRPAATRAPTPPPTRPLTQPPRKPLTRPPRRPPVTVARPVPRSKPVQQQQRTLTWTPVHQQTSGQLLQKRWMSNGARNMLLNEHNKYRRKVPAANMRKMVWSPELERTAQMHSDRCQFGHSTSVNRGGDYGENIWAGTRLDVMDVVRRWYIEVDDVYCQCPHSYKHCCGHYTQVVWAQTFMLGCGISECASLWDMGTSRWKFVVVCHYWPQGNIISYGRGGVRALPAFNWRNPNSPACTQCINEVGKRLAWNFRYCDQGLCST